MLEEGSEEQALVGLKTQVKPRQTQSAAMSGAKARSDAPVAENVSSGGHGSAAPTRDRKPGGGVLKRLKSRRSQVESRPVTEEELRTKSGHISPEDVLGLRVATRGLGSLSLRARLAELQKNRA